MTAIDHKAEAESFLSSTQRMFWDDSSWPEVAAHHAAAQVHATLYLAEQQRIATLVALATPMRNESGLKPSVFFSVWRMPRDNEHGTYDLRPEIREGLGLA